MIRSRAMRWLMLGFGVLTLLAGVAILLTGDEDPVVAALVLFPFGALLVVFGLSRPPERGSRAGVAREGDAVVFAVSDRRRGIAVIGSLLFVLVGIGIAASGSVVLGVLCALTFLVFGVIGSIKRGGPVVLSPRELTANGRTVPWEDVEEVTRMTIRHSELLGFQLRRDAKRSPWASVNRFLGAELSVAYSQIEGDPELLAGLAEELQAASSPEARAAAINRFM